MKPEFDRRDVKIIGLSVDSVDSHRKWIRDINETQKTEVCFPLIGDDDKKVSELYGMIHPNADNTFTVRSVFIVSPEKKVALLLTYPAATGRNFDEILRVIDSLQLTANHKVATPVNWENGDECIILPDIPDKEVPSLFPKGCTTVKPYLRYTPQPNR